MLDLDKISKDYYKIMYHEYLTIKKFIKPKSKYFKYRSWNRWFRGHN